MIFPDSEFPGYPEVDGVEDDDGEAVHDGGNVAEDSTEDVLQSLLWFQTFLVNWGQTYKNYPGTESKILTQIIKFFSFFFFLFNFKILLSPCKISSLNNFFIGEKNLKFSKWFVSKV